METGGVMKMEMSERENGREEDELIRFANHLPKKRMMVERTAF